MAMHTSKWPAPPTMSYYTESTVIGIRTPHSLNLSPCNIHIFLAPEECITQGMSVYVARLTVAD
jgi:hypothetical protein